MIPHFESFIYIGTFDSVTECANMDVKSKECITIFKINPRDYVIPVQNLFIYFVLIGSLLYILDVKTKQY